MLRLIRRGFNMTKYDYVIEGIDGECINLVSCFMAVEGGYICFYNEKAELTCIFYRPKTVIRAGVHKND